MHYLGLYVHMKMHVRIPLLWCMVND